MKQIGLLASVVFIVWLGYKFFQSPERYLKKTSEKIIKVVSVKGAHSDMSLISKVSKIAKFIHFDVQLKAEYENQIYKAHSLNEFRSLLFTYFRNGATGEVTYDNLYVTMDKNQERGVVKFDVYFKRGRKNVFCKALFEWIKEKKWYVKRIEVLPCSPSTL